jgi:hypothetical protein
LEPDTPAMSAPAIAAHLTPAHVETIDAVIKRMVALRAALPEKDGVARFNHLYLEMTRTVRRALRRGVFHDPRFAETLDVRFANLYFDALLRHLENPETAPRAWRPLFSARGRRDIAPIQFALAGMNAHINRDLPVAVVETCRKLGVRMDATRHRDYLAINPLLERTQARVKKDLATGLVGVIDRILGRIDDVVAIWSLTRARDAAWTHARTLRTIEGFPEVAEAYLLTLDRMVGFAGRGLLVATLIP